MLLSIDVKSKLIVTIIMIFLSVLLISIEQLILVYLYWVMVMILFKPRIRGILTKSIPVLPLIISLGILAWWGKTNGHVLRFGEAHIAYSRIGLATFLVLRSVLIVFFTLSLIESEESFFPIIYALDELQAPSLIINILLFMYRTFIDLKVEAEKMLDARYSRGAWISSWASLRSYRIIGYMIGNVFVRAVDKSYRRRDALKSRMFMGKFHHKPITFSFSGMVFTWFSVVFTLIVLLLANIRVINYGILKAY